jgi:hypothetical protein
LERAQTALENARHRLDPLGDFDARGQQCFSPSHEPDLAFPWDVGISSMQYFSAYYFVLWLSVPGPAVFKLCIHAQDIGYHDLS